MKEVKDIFKNSPAGSVLKVENLSFSYDEALVLKNLSLEVKKGDFISIIGPNGSGKSTLINLLSRVLKGFEGSISIFEKDIKSLSAREVARLIAVVPQYSNPGFDFNVEEMVLMGRFPYISRFGSEGRQDYDIVADIMEKTKVSGLSRKKFNELSGGEKQRVVIAQALAQDTPILLLDEPTSHLDINFQIELMELFYKLNLNGEKTIIGVFHDINLAANYSRTAILLKNGQVYAQGDIDSVINKENIQNVFQSNVYVGKNPFTGKIYISPTFSAATATNHDAHKTRIHVIGGGGAATPLLNMLANIGYTLTCGVVNNFDTDLDTAKILGISYVSEAPFSPVSLYSQNRNMELIKASDIVILPQIAFGHGNFSNIVSVKEAIDMGKRVIVVNEKDISERDYTEGKACAVYKKIIERGAVVVKDIKEIPAII